MLSLDTACKIAEASTPEGVELSRVQELQKGWYFPALSREADVIGGYCGLVVNKETGEVYRVPGSARGVERDLELYDRGYQFDVYDLVVLEVKKWNQTLRVLLDLRISEVKPEYEHGTVWRVPRRLTASELRDRLSCLPCIFENVRPYFVLERLEEARQRAHFRFEVLKHGRSA